MGKNVERKRGESGSESGKGRVHSATKPDRSHQAFTGEKNILHLLAFISSSIVLFGIPSNWQ